MVVEHRRRVKGPARFRYGRRRIGPAVGDELIDAFEQKRIRLGLDIQWCGAEGAAVQPRPAFGGGDRIAVDMIGRTGPARGGKGAPIGLLAFRQGDQPVR